LGFEGWDFGGEGGGIWFMSLGGEIYMFCFDMGKKLLLGCWSCPNYCASHPSSSKGKR
jgi:hypothetical protein